MDSLPPMLTPVRMAFPPSVDVRHDELYQPACLRKHVADNFRYSERGFHAINVRDLQRDDDVWFRWALHHSLRLLIEAAFNGVLFFEHSQERWQGWIRICQALRGFRSDLRALRPPGSGAQLKYAAQYPPESLVAHPFGELLHKALL